MDEFDNEAWEGALQMLGLIHDPEEEKTFWDAEQKRKIAYNEQAFWDDLKESVGKAVRSEK